MAAHEVSCFAERLGVRPERIRTWSLLDGAPTNGALEGADALLFGGSGDFSVTGSEPWLREMFRFCEEVVVGRAFPTFASCFGFQALVVAGGGRVETDRDRAEVGTFALTVTDDGRKDPWTAHLPETFTAQLGHKDHAVVLPAGVRNLASSVRSPNQALRVDGLPVVGTQFHPELDKAAQTTRYLSYRDSYGPGDVPDDPILRSIRETPEASGLLRRWLETDLLPRLRGGED